MAVRITKDLVCDMCQSDEGVKRWRVVLMGEGKQVSPDLCVTHSAPFDEAMKLLPGGKRGQVRKRQVKTPAQVKALREKK